MRRSLGSAHPHPLMPAAGRPNRAVAGANTGPFGGAVANEARPAAVAAQS